MTQEEIDELENNMFKAAEHLNQKGKGRTLNEGAYKACMLYDFAYQQLVKAGLREQLKRKYRMK